MILVLSRVDFSINRTRVYFGQNQSLARFTCSRAAMLCSTNSHRARQQEEQLIVAICPQHESGRAVSGS